MGSMVNGWGVALTAWALFFGITAINVKLSLDFLEDPTQAYGR